MFVTIYLIGGITTWVVWMLRFFWPMTDRLRIEASKRVDKKLTEEVNRIPNRIFGVFLGSLLLWWVIAWIMILAPKFLLDTAVEKYLENYDQV